MMERGYDVKVITTMDWNFKRYDALFFPLAKVLRYPVIFQIKKAKIYFHPDILKEICQTYDIVHSFTFFTFSSVLATLVMSGVKVIRAEVGTPKRLDFVKARHGVYSTLVNVYKGSYDYITVYNRLEAKSLDLLGFPKERIVILPPIVDFEIFSSLCSAHGISSINIGIIGRISPEKGIHRVVPIIKETLKGVPDASRRLKLFLAGRIDDERYARKILMDLRNLLQSRFIYLGEVAPPYRFYKSVDIVIVPSLIETGAIVVLEAMAAGKCVVASNIYPINLYISHGLNGFLFNTPSEAAKIVLDIIRGYIDVKFISREAQKYAKKHDYRVVCQALEKIYHHSSR
jgi:glycosyltransferase involved in cell wall biosynthesis